MNPWELLLDEARQLRVHQAVVVLVLVYVLTRIVAPRYGRRLRTAFGVAAVYIALIPASAYLGVVHSSAHNDVRLVAMSLGTLACVSAIGTLVFGALEARLRVSIPQIVYDLIISTVSIVAISITASRMGVNLSGLLTTSAVLTAVIGLALQDTLGNVVAGIALQIDSSIRIGDWIKIGDVSGRVSEIRWRYTAIETRNWETVILPNSQLIKGQVTVLGRRTGEPRRWRRIIYFNVDFRYSPTLVIDAVQNALRNEPIANVSIAPAPNCVLIDICDSYYRFAVRFWIEDPGNDDPTDSAIRTRVINALKRVDVPLSIPAKAVFVTSDTEERRTEKRNRDLEDRVSWLRRIDLFGSLSVDEAGRLAAGLNAIPFAPGEVLTRQGAEAHWLYIVLSGTVAVRVQHEDMEREVAQLGPGQFFGEMALLTGALRTATVVAVDEVKCYRLGKDDFKQLVQARPEIAEEVANILARRQTELAAARDDLDAEARQNHERATATDLLQKMRNFFGLEKGTAPGQIQPTGKASLRP